MKHTLQRVLLALVVISGASAPLCAMKNTNNGGYVPYKPSGLSWKTMAALGLGGSAAWYLYNNDEYSKPIKDYYDSAANWAETNIDKKTGYMLAAGGAVLGYLGWKWWNQGAQEKRFEFTAPNHKDVERAFDDSYSGRVNDAPAWSLRLYEFLNNEVFKSISDEESRFAAMSPYLEQGCLDPHNLLKKEFKPVIDRLSYDQKQMLCLIFEEFTLHTLRKTAEQLNREYSHGLLEAVLEEQGSSQEIRQAMNLVLNDVNYKLKGLVKKKLAYIATCEQIQRNYKQNLRKNGTRRPARNNKRKPTPRRRR